MKIRLKPFLRDLQRILGIVNNAAAVVDAVKSDRPKQRKIETVAGRVMLIKDAADNLQEKS